MVESILACMRCQYCPHCGCDVAPGRGRQCVRCPQCGRGLRAKHLVRAPILRGFLPLVFATGLSPGLLALFGVLIEITGFAHGSSRTFTCAAFIAAPFVLCAWSSAILRRAGEPVGILGGVPVAILMLLANALLLGIGLSLVGVAVGAY